MSTRFPAAFAVAVLHALVATGVRAQSVEEEVADADTQVAAGHAFGASTAYAPSGEPDPFGASTGYAPDTDATQPAGEALGDDFGATARDAADSDEEIETSLARSVVTRRQMDERLPRSAPDALRYEPGVSIQQTAHGQASPYVRGMTGQQVVHLFDGIRMNNGIYRQGPNQYFFSIDSTTLQELEVLRGSASTRFGSDALGGAILAAPRGAILDSSSQGFRVRPRLYGRYASADQELGGRGELEFQLSKRTGLLMGGGYRDADLLESAGEVRGLEEDQLLAKERYRLAAISTSPTFAADGRTQLGTGFREGTFDARLTHRLHPSVELVAALYGYRQYDAPRTDQCPPIEAQRTDCWWVDEQFRTLGYVGLRANAGPAMQNLVLNLSWQEHHERRVMDQTESERVQHIFRNDVATLGLSLQAETAALSLMQTQWRVRYGADAYRDRVESNAFRHLTDVGYVRKEPRGQYIEGSSYLTTGAFVELEAQPVDWLTLRGGGRLAGAAARAAAQPESNSTGVDRAWAAWVSRGGVEVRPLPSTRIYFNVDQGFRAPNLDDLTARQQVQGGFQFENTALVPERSTSYELGSKLDLGWLEVEGWGFVTLVDNAMLRVPVNDCPDAAAGCEQAWYRHQIQNAAGRTVITGAEGGATVRTPWGIDLRSTASYTWGEADDVRNAEQGRVRDPVSRIPPLNVTAEARYRHLASGVYAGAAVRWAADQRRLSEADVNDVRIPVGGTPGYTTADLRAGWRYSDHLRLSLVFENIFDVAYRVHGSSVNGPGRGVMAGLMLGW